MLGRGRHFLAGAGTLLLTRTLLTELWKIPREPLFDFVCNPLLLRGEHEGARAGAALTANPFVLGRQLVIVTATTLASSGPLASINRGGHTSADPAV